MWTSSLRTTGGGVHYSVVATQWSLVFMADCNSYAIAGYYWTKTPSTDFSLYCKSRSVQESYQQVLGEYKQKIWNDPFMIIAIDKLPQGSHKP